MGSLNDDYPVSDRQQAIVDHSEGTLVVVAGPGTGKTYGLLLRIDALTASGVDEEGIWYVSFIKKIVQEFEKDLAGFCSKKGRKVPEIEMATLHSLAWRVLRNLGYLIDLPEAVEVFSLTKGDEIGAVLLKDIRAEMGRDGAARSASQIKALSKKYQRAQQELVDPASLEGLEKAFAAILEKMCTELQCLDWDRVVPLCLGALERAEGRPAWLTRVEHLSCDEYQDFNPAEQQFLRILEGEASTTVIVGDPYQSIYSGRGASPEKLESLASDESNNSVNLVVCRRCPTSITDAANGTLRVMAGDAFDSVKLVPLDPERVGRLRVCSTKSAKSEIALLKSEIENLIAEGPAESLRDILALFPNRATAAKYAGLLEEEGVGCRLRTDKDELITWLQVVIKYAKRSGHPLFERMFLSRFSRLEPRYVPEIRGCLEECSGEVKEAARRAADKFNWGKSQRTQLADYLGLLSDILSGEPEKVRRALEQTSGAALEDESLDLIATMLDQEPEASLEEFAEYHASLLLESSNGGEEEEDYLEILTIHSAKGLDRNCILVPACEDSQIPGFSEAVAEDLGESRRLFYVALSRAKESLLISYPRTRDRKRTVPGRTDGQGTSSRFIVETGVPVERLE